MFIPPPPPQSGEPAAERPKGKRKPWIPPSFECVDMDLIGHGKSYWDNDDASTPGGQSVDPNPTGYHPSHDQTNPYNS